MLYQKFGYKPKGLVVITAKHLDRREIVQRDAKPAKPGLGVRRYSSLEEAKKKPAMRKIHRITNARLARAWTWARKSRSSTGSPSATPCSSRRGGR